MALLIPSRDVVPMWIQMKDSGHCAASYKKETRYEMARREAWKPLTQQARGANNGNG